MKNGNEKTYKWRGIDTNFKKCAGKITAATIETATIKLQQSGILPFVVQPKFCNRLKLYSKKIPSEKILGLTHQLAVLTNANIPIIKAFEIIKNSSNHLALKNLIAILKADVEKGESLSAVFRKQPLYFNNFFCSLIKIGETAGTLDTMLQYLATYYAKSKSNRQKFKKILFYPAMVFSFALVITVCLLVFVIPEFETLYLSLNATLPIYTQDIIQLAKFLKNYGLAIGGIFGGLISSMILMQKYSLKMQQFIDKMKLQTPLFGETIAKFCIARFMRSLAVTIHAGLPLDEALALSQTVITNRVYQKGIYEIQAAITQGRSLYQALAQTALFADYTLQRVSIGEESGTLDAMLFSIATHYEDEISQVLDNLQSLLEPLLMAVLGILIGSIVIGMYLPILQLGRMM